MTVPEIVLQLPLALVRQPVGVENLQEQIRRLIGHDLDETSVGFD
jgi:hypothetical protein